MKLKYVNQIKANLSIRSHQKTSNLLDGTYKSVYKGKSMNFENLREYVMNDDVKDIDWKASSRSGTLLVKQFIAEKKHNILLVMDTGIKMQGDTSTGEPKREVALFSGGTIGYIAIKNGDYVGMVYNAADKIVYKPFQLDVYSLERYLTEYASASLIANENGLEKTIQYLCRNIKKRMIVFVITDLKGMNDLSDKILKEVATLHDVLFINVEDASITNVNAFDLDQERYIPPMLQKDPKLAMVENNLRNSIYAKNQKRMKKYKIDVISVSGTAHVSLKMIELLERHKYANVH